MIKNSKRFIPIDWKFCSEESPALEPQNKPDADGADTKGQDEPNDDLGGQDAKFTQEDLNKIVADRLSRERSKLQKEFDSKLEVSLQEARTEAEKLAKMNSEQKAQYEKEKLESNLKQQEQALNDRAAEIARKEMDMQVKDILTEKGFPPNLSVLIQAEDAEQATEKIGVLEEYLKTAVTDMTNAALRGRGNLKLPDRANEDPFLQGFNSKY